MTLKIYFGNLEDSKHIIKFLKHDKTPLENSEFIVCSLPWGFTDGEELQKMINQCLGLNKNVLIFLVSDYSETFSLPKNVFLFRTSILESKQNKREFILPYLWGNINFNQIPLERTKNPIVGFCGLNSPHRVNLINKLLKLNDKVICNFVLRDQFWGGKPNDPDLVRQYQDNMINSHFMVCNRGAGNFSMRFYETLASGRIPVLIDTDMVFPYENLIDWDNIIVREKTEDKLISKLMSWWQNKDIISIQNSCKQIYNEYFDGEDAINKLIKHYIG